MWLVQMCLDPCNFSLSIYQIALPLFGVLADRLHFMSKTMYNLALPGVVTFIHI